MKFHFSLPIKKLNESLEFYEILGFSKINEWARPEKEQQAFVLEKDGCVLELVLDPKNMNHNLGEIDNLHLGLEVTDVEELLNTLKEKGVEIKRPKTSGITVKCFAFIKGPNGFAVEIFESK